MNLEVIHSILLSVTMAYRSISLMLSSFEGVLVPCKHSSMLQIKAKFSVAFIHALILLLGSFLLLARRSAVCEKKQLHSLLVPPKHENTSGVNDPCSTWRIRWLYSRFFPFSFFLWTAGTLKCKWHPANGLKTLTSQKAVCLLIHNPLADTSALAWLFIFEDSTSSSPVNGVSNGTITTYFGKLYFHFKGFWSLRANCRLSCGFDIYISQSGDSSYIFKIMNYKFNKFTATEKILKIAAGSKLWNYNKNSKKFTKIFLLKTTRQIRILKSYFKNPRLQKIISWWCWWQWTALWNCQMKKVSSLISTCHIVGGYDHCKLPTYYMQLSTWLLCCLPVNP